MRHLANYFMPGIILPDVAPRPAIHIGKQSDARAIAGLESLCFRTSERLSFEAIEAELDHPWRFARVARFGGSALGYMFCQYDRFQDVRITRIAVDPMQRRTGIGAALVHALDDKRHPMPKYPGVTCAIRTVVCEMDVEALRFFTSKAVGFTATGSVREAYRVEERGVWVQRDGVELQA